MIKRIKADRHAPELKQLAGLLAETIGAKYGPEVLSDTLFQCPCTGSNSCVGDLTKATVESSNSA
jgi:hypothetical protein